MLPAPHKRSNDMLRAFALTFILSFIVFSMLILPVTHALAQTTVDLRPAASSALEWIAGALGTVLTVLGGFAIRFVSAKTGLAGSEFEASLNARLSDIIHNGIQYAYTIALNEVNKKGSGLEAVKVDNYFIALAATYVNNHAPEIIAKFKLNQNAVENMIKARLGAFLPNVPVDGGLPTPPAPATLATAA